MKTNNIRNNILTFSGKNDFFYIDDLTDEKMKSTKLKEKDILINIVGATTDVIGRSSLIMEISKSINQYGLNRIKRFGIFLEYSLFFQPFWGTSVRELQSTRGIIQLEGWGIFFPPFPTIFQPLGKLVQLGPKI